MFVTSDLKTRNKLIEERNLMRTTEETGLRKMASSNFVLVCLTFCPI